MQIGYMQIRLIKKYFSINKIEIVHNQLITNYKKVEQKIINFHNKIINHLILL